MSEANNTLKFAVGAFCLVVIGVTAYSLRGPDSVQSVAHWAFESNGKDSGGKHDLAIGMGAPNPEPFSEGKIGLAMSQRGNAPGFITPRPPIFDSTKDFTISVWAYLEPRIYDNDAILDTGSIYLARRDAPPWNSRIGAFFYANEYKQQIEIVDNSDFGPPPYRTWFHVLLFRKGNIAGLKVNNKGSAQLDVSSVKNPGGPMMFVGIQQYGYPWQGRLDELKIWDRALTDEQMTAVYEAGNQ